MEWGENRGEGGLFPSFPHFGFFFDRGWVLQLANHLKRDDLNKLRQLAFPTVEKFQAA